MTPAPIPSNETQRLAALHRYRILDTEAQTEYDDIARLAAQICGTPISLVSLVDSQRQWFKSRVGLEVLETPREVSFCGHAIHGSEVFEISNTLEDERFADNPLVTEDTHIRFYAGTPLMTPQGDAIGTLCVLDRVPHQLTSAQKTALTTLGRQVVRLMELRLGLAREQALNAKIARQAQFQKVLLDSAVAAVISSTPDGLITSFNPAAERLLGYRAEDVIGIESVGLFHVKEEMQARAQELSVELGHPVKTREALVAKVHSGASETREWSYRRRDGALVPVMLSMAVLQDEQDAVIGYVALAWDITERKRLDQAKAAFVSTVSHELRTPLTSINGALGLACGGILGELPPPAKPMLEMAYMNGQRLARLIDDLLDMEKMAAGKMRLVLEVEELMPLVEQAIDSMAFYSQQHQIQLVLAERANGVRVRVDAGRLQQVLSNLLSNAAKFSPPGSQVAVAVRALGGAVRVEVLDQGSGVPDDFRERIFQKFSQADASDTRQKGGSGLGLAISKDLIERMNGLMGFESQPGQGSNFHFELPVWHEPRAATEVTSDPLPEATRILVVENDPDLARELVSMLRRAGYGVDVASTGAQAVEDIKRHRYAAITLAMLLPDQTGVSLIRQLRWQPGFEKLPIVVVSSFIEDGKQAIQDEFLDIEWLSPPLDEARLKAVLSRHATVVIQAGVPSATVPHSYSFTI